MNVASVVFGPCGDVLTRRELPPSFRLRWTARRKAEVVIAVETGILSLDEVATDICKRVSTLQATGAVIEKLGEADFDGASANG